MEIERVCHPLLPLGAQLSNSLKSASYAPRNEMTRNDTKPFRKFEIAALSTSLDPSAKVRVLYCGVESLSARPSSVFFDHSLHPTYSAQTCHIYIQDERFYPTQTTPATIASDFLTIATFSEQSLLPAAVRCTAGLVGWKDCQSLPDALTMIVLSLSTRSP